MLAISKPLSLFHFLCGLIVGLFIGMSIDQQWSVVATRTISAAALVLIVLFWSRFEDFACKRYLELWQQHRAHGKWRFILTHYVLVRGTVLFPVVASPMFSIITLTPLTIVIIGTSILVLVVLLAYLGHETWVQCDQDYDVFVLRAAAEQLRTATN